MLKLLENVDLGGILRHVIVAPDKSTTQGGTKQLNFLLLHYFQHSSEPTPLFLLFISLNYFLVHILGYLFNVI